MYKKWCASHVFFLVILPAAKRRKIVHFFMVMILKTIVKSNWEKIYVTPKYKRKTDMTQTGDKTIKKQVPVYVYVIFCTQYLTALISSEGLTLQISIFNLARSILSSRCHEMHKSRNTKWIYIDVHSLGPNQFKILLTMALEYRDCIIHLQSLILSFFTKK